MIEALSFLHTNCKCIHRNICPHSIYVTRSGTWKLGGLEFLGKTYSISKTVACLSNASVDNLYSYLHILHFYIRRIFAEKFGGDAVHEEVPCAAWTTKAPKFVQPDLNFIGK